MEFATFMIFGMVCFLIGQAVGFRTALNGGYAIARFTVKQVERDFHELQLKRQEQRDE